jgi:hypothetical protein
MVRASELSISEREFMVQVIELAQWYRWKVYHTFDSRRSTAGWPDLAMTRAGTLNNPARLVLAELKSTKGRLTLEQMDWLAALGQVPHVETYCWRPADWDQIVNILK